jgi:hypothetical protein
MIQHFNTLLPLASWFKIMGISLFEGAQVGLGFPRPLTNQCQSVWYEYPWQKDFVSRYEVAQAVDEAESALAEQLGYWPAPKYIVDEHVSLSRGHPLNPSTCGANSWGWWKGVSLRWGQFRGGGAFNRTLISAGVAVVLSDNDGDGVDDLFTITVATSVTDPDEIAIYFNAVDRDSAPIAETWRLRPVTVSISGGSATITGHPSLLVLPDTQTAMTADVLNVTTAAIFATTVDIYRVFLDTTHSDSFPYQGVAVWDAAADCVGDCAVQVLPLCLGEGRGGRVFAEYGNTTCWPYAWQADRLQVNYLAGYPLDDDGQMNREMARLVAYLATALLPTDKCGCERSNRIIHHWRAKPNEGDAGRSFTQAEIDSNPFVERNGALWAWKRIQNLRETGAVLA